MKTIVNIGLMVFLLIGGHLLAQTPSGQFQYGRLSLGARAGYDLLPSYQNTYDHLRYDGGLKLGANLEYRVLGGFTLGVDYDYIQNQPGTTLPADIYYGLTPVSSQIERMQVRRQFLGIGPGYTAFLGDRVRLGIQSRVGVGNVTGGDILVSAINPISNVKDAHLVQTGWDGSLHLSAKGRIGVDYMLTDFVGLYAGVYYQQHFRVKQDPVLDIGTPSNIGIVYGTTDFDIGSQGEYAVSTRPAQIVKGPACNNISSLGLEAGVTFHLPASAPRAPRETASRPSPGKNLVIMVVDRPTGKKIPNADVAVTNSQGEIVSTGKTNAYGAVEVPGLTSGNYRVDGKVFGVETTKESIKDYEFTSGQTITKVLYYEDLRFILQGLTTNKQRSNPEPGVLVRLTQDGSGRVKQATSDQEGAFAFRLEPNASYEVIGIKENRLSDIAAASTVGLTRSTTLFVELELGMDEIDCNHGAVLDIKYDLDKHFLRPEAKFELERLVSYLREHPTSQVELSSHTDSRGSDSYNLDLSERRAQSAVDYILSRGISRDRITARGYGESRLVNRCRNGVPCSESEHQANRRTEAKLICH